MVLPNQVHYNINVNKRIKLIEEIYKWHCGQIHHILSQRTIVI